MAALVLILAIFLLPLMGLAQQQPMNNREYQSPQEYIEFVKNSLALYQQKKITSLEFENVFFPVGSMQFFLSYNYENPEVTALLQSIQQAKVSESIASNVSDYISGRQKQRDIYLRKAHPELVNPVPLLSGGYAPPDLEPSITPDPMSAPLWLKDQKVIDKTTVPLGPPPSSLASAIQQPKSAASPTPVQIEQSSSWRVPIWPVVILGTLIVAGAVFLLRRGSR